jgi:hypothetical protein
MALLTDTGWTAFTWRCVWIFTVRRATFYRMTLFFSILNKNKLFLTSHYMTKYRSAKYNYLLTKAMFLFN